MWRNNNNWDNKCDILWRRYKFKSNHQPKTQKVGLKENTISTVRTWIVWNQCWTCQVGRKVLLPSWHIHVRPIWDTWLIEHIFVFHYRKTIPWNLLTKQMESKSMSHSFACMLAPTATSLKTRWAHWSTCEHLLGGVDCSCRRYNNVAGWSAVSALWTALH